MVKSSDSCHSLTNRERRWPYDQYYLGCRKNGQRQGKGENCWSGAESLESYKGRFLRDTMHGEGYYRWRHMDPNGSFTTYEGWFYANSMHGYGVMSYKDGKTFTGLYYKNARWGPGVENSLSHYANVGLWRGMQLARLAWRPGPNVVPDFATGTQGASYLNKYRIILTQCVKKPGESSRAVDLLKQQGMNPLDADKEWPKLFPRYSNDEHSVLFHRDLFDFKYYNDSIVSLEERLDTLTTRQNSGINTDTIDEEQIPPSFYAWNNGAMLLHMMKHSFQHEGQRLKVNLNLQTVLCGPRSQHAPPGKHEINCRMLLMACYLGRISNVAQLVNEENVFCDLADVRGNTALMYAVCGDKTDIIHFLVEAGASVNSINDSCCTPLGIALVRFLLLAREIPSNRATQALLPNIQPPAPPRLSKYEIITKIESDVQEWHMKRDAPEELSSFVRLRPQSISARASPPAPAVARGHSAVAIKRGKSVTSWKSASRLNSVLNQKSEQESLNEEMTDEKNKLSSMNADYIARIEDLPQIVNTAVEIPYLFQIPDLPNLEVEVENAGKHQKSTAAAKGKKSMIDAKRMSVWENMNIASDSSVVKQTAEALSKVHLTILQLLSEGADISLVRCPQPALVLACKSLCPDMVKHVVSHGADVNEKFPLLNNYTALGILLTDPITRDTVPMLRALLEMGADPNIRLEAASQSEIPGPTILHVIIAKPIHNESEQDIMKEVFEELLDHKCDPFLLYKEHSVMDIIMMKKIDLLLTFIKSPNLDLNRPINSTNQTILVKFFSRDFFRTTLMTGLDRLPIITNLLLYGADPLLRCVSGDHIYANLFEVTRRNYVDMTTARRTMMIDIGSMSGGKKSGVGRAKSIVGQAKSIVGQAKSIVGQSKSGGAKLVPAEAVEYNSAVELLTECARMLYVRWLQGKLIKELIDVINKFKHRPWNTIIREHEHSLQVGLWLNTLRCLEIWDMLKTTKKKIYTDEVILRKLLCIVQFYQKRVKAKLPIDTVMASEKNTIEADVGFLMREHKITSRLADEAETMKKNYVKPEILVGEDNKFRVCFECSRRLKDFSILCEFCGMVSFCNDRCIENNVNRVTGHPCSEQLKQKLLAQAEDNDSFSDIYDKYFR